jgi:hypothetical protein
VSLDPDSGSRKMLDPDPDSLNPDPQLFLRRVLSEKLLAKEEDEDDITMGKFFNFLPSSQFFSRDTVRFNKNIYPIGILCHNYCSVVCRTYVLIIIFKVFSIVT